MMLEGASAQGPEEGSRATTGDPVLFVDEATPDEVAEIYALPGYELKGVVWGNTSDGQKVFKASLMKDNKEWLVNAQAQEVATIAARARRRYEQRNAGEK